MFFYLVLQEDSQMYFNLYVPQNTWKHKRCPPDWSASPRYARDAMLTTCSKLANNISNTDFPLEDYDSFLAKFVENLAVYTPKTLPPSYKG